MFRNSFAFSGRIRRLEYGISFIIASILYLLIYIFLESSDSLALIGFLLIIPSVWFLFSQGSKRCHDIGKNAWYQIIPFYWIVMLFQDGDSGMNTYGHNPKTHPHLADMEQLNSETLDGHFGSDNHPRVS
jgi:uncharacterized membrane protein YhaH (DUF805 family)